MRRPAPLIAGRLVRRYKRFLADVVLEDGGEVTVHCPNPGRMLGLDAPGAPVWVSRAGNPRRALPFTLELVQANGGLVGINTLHPNRLVEEAVAAGAIAELRGYDVIRREVRYDERCRIDLLLHGSGRPDCFVEVKNVHLKRSAGAEFPDAVTARGAKHLGALARQVAQGARAVVVYVVQRTDCADFRIAADIDPIYAAGFAAALDGGVEAVCYGCEVSLDGVRLAAPLPICLS
jgi:sugar fermentation stimulation protein A